MKPLFLLPLLLWLLLPSCKDDDYAYPDVLTQFVDLQTDPSGRAFRLLTDEGTSWSIQPREGLDGLVADTTYRTVTMYAPRTANSGAERQADVYRIQLIHAPRPRPAAQFKAIHTDPVDLQSIWRSGNYLNLILQVKVKEQAHTYHFIEDALEAHPDGSHTLHLTLYHDRAGDPEAFHQRTYLSVPLRTYEGILHPGDEILFTLHTYEEGPITRRFTY